jgi:sialate O-acetylesterase
MVVQHDQPFRLWGHARPMASIQASLNGETGSTQANETGYWELYLASPPPGGPYELRIITDEEERSIGNVLSGEVWLASGQSNMEWALSNTEGGEEAMASADDPWLRLFKVERTAADAPQTNVEGAWRLSTSNHAANFSAIGWHFGKRMRSLSGMPVGVIQSAWGGTSIETWMPREAMEKIPFMKARLDAHGTSSHQLEELALTTSIAELRENHRELKHLADPGNRGFLMGYAFPGADDAKWEVVELPGLLERSYGPVDGAFWFRKTVHLPSHWEGKEAILSLGKIDDFDTTYFNGIAIGSTDTSISNAYSKERVYRVPGHLLRTGPEANVIAVRVFDRYRDGGFTGSPSAMFISPEESSTNDQISLSGEWRTIAELTAVDPERGPLSRHLLSRPGNPSVLFNGMIAPLAGYPLRGALWYQGESNTSRPEEYATLFPGMIEAWRNAWKIGGFPFYYVELANFKQLQQDPVEQGWAYLREAQEAALLLPHVEKAVILDAGEADDIHPRDKETPALRLAAHAEALIYGHDIPHRSPRFSHFRVDDHRLHLFFEDVYNGLQTQDGSPMRGFAVMGADQQWRWAVVEQLGQSHLALSHPEVAEPVAARYAWASNPVGNVVNSAGFPLGGFRTGK